MWAVTGLLAGTEHKETYTLDSNRLFTAERFTIEEGAAHSHPVNVIHTAHNPKPSVSWGIHVSGGNPATADASEWDPAIGCSRTVDPRPGHGDWLH
jgi:hypothetical protein